jgi:hypothetical protein
MNVELITRDDLRRLEDLLKEIKQIIQPGQSQPKKWLKSREVRKDAEYITRHLTEPAHQRYTLRYTKMGASCITS